MKVVRKVFLCLERQSWFLTVYVFTTCLVLLPSSEDPKRDIWRIKKLCGVQSFLNSKKNWRIVEESFSQGSLIVPGVNPSLKSRGTMPTWSHHISFSRQAFKEQRRKSFLGRAAKYLSSSICGDETDEPTPRKARITCGKLSSLSGTNETPS